MVPVKHVLTSIYFSECIVFQVSECLNFGFMKFRLFLFHSLILNLQLRLVSAMLLIILHSDVHPLPVDCLHRTGTALSAPSRRSLVVLGQAAMCR